MGTKSFNKNKNRLTFGLVFFHTVVQKFVKLQLQVFVFPDMSATSKYEEVMPQSDEFKPGIITMKYRKNLKKSKKKKNL